MERRVAEYERYLQQQRTDEVGAISASNKTAEEMARDEARFERQWFSRKIDWAFTITPESPDSDEKFAVRLAVYRVQGSMYGPIAGAPRQDVQVLLKAADAVPGVGVAALGLDATIHAYHDE